MPSSESACRVCGYDFVDWAPWGADGRSPSFEFCPSCRVEFGYQDANLAAIRGWREQWLAKGAPWDDATTPRDGLSVEQRLTHVPVRFR